MQTLEEAQDTNRRLNRRVSVAEAPLTALIGKAQQEATLAQRAAGDAHAALSRWMKYYDREAVRSQARMEELDRIGWMRFLFWPVLAWAVAASAALVFWR